jgi:competence protein ComGC
MKRQSPERGFGVISLLLALLVIGLLYLWLTGWVPSGVSSTTEAQIIKKSSVDLSCRMNLQALDKEIITWSVTHPGQKPTLEGLQSSGVLILGCPEGGKWSIQSGHARCSVHLPPR